VTMKPPSAAAFRVSTSLPSETVYDLATPGILAARGKPCRSDEDQPITAPRRTSTRVPPVRAPFHRRSSPGGAELTAEVEAGIISGAHETASSADALRSGIPVRTAGRQRRRPGPVSAAPRPEARGARPIAPCGRRR
jgi:hypothetical protein